MQALKLITENDFWGEYEVIKENVEGKGIVRSNFVVRSCKLKKKT